MVGGSVILSEDTPLALAGYVVTGQGEVYGGGLGSSIPGRGVGSVENGKAVVSGEVYDRLRAIIAVIAHGVPGRVVGVHIP